MDTDDKNYHLKKAEIIKNLEKSKIKILETEIIELMIVIKRQEEVINKIRTISMTSINFVKKSSKNIYKY